jgi:tetratricopeptide (TPR) repeat protein
LAAQLERLVPDGEHMDKEAYNTYFFQTIHAAASNSMVGRAASASLLDRVGRCQASRGQYSTAEETHRQALSVRKDVLGHDHLKTLVSMNNVAGVLSGQGSYAEAETMHRETLKLSKKVLGNEHLATLTSMSNLAGALGQQKKYSEAEEMHRETLELRKKMLGNEHPHTLLSMYGLAHLLAKQLLYDDSRFLYEQACAGYDVALGRDHFIARACHQHYRQMLALQQRDRIEFRSKVPESGVDVSGSKRRKEI